MSCEWMYRCPACSFTHETWTVCHEHMIHCCSHLLFTREGKKRKSKKFRVPNFQAATGKGVEKAAAKTKRKHRNSAAKLADEKARAVSVVDPTRPYMCPAVGCTERYGTRERCERHILVCASAIAHCRGDKERLRQLQPLFVGVDGDAADENGGTLAAAGAGAGGQNSISSGSSSGRQTNHSTKIAPENKKSETTQKQEEDLQKQPENITYTRASLPFMCPAHGCGERYETRERCERHLRVCARAIAHHRRKDEAKQLRPAFVGGGSTICNTAWGEPNAAADVSDEAFEFAPPTSSHAQNGNPTQFMPRSNQNANQVDMANLSFDRVSRLAPYPNNGNGTYSPYPQLPERFGSYNCLRCSSGYTNWVDCVAHMVGCCNEVYEHGKLWGGVEAVRIRCGVQEPSSKRCTHCGSFKSKQDFQSTEWAEIGKANRNRQCKDCFGSIK